MNTRRSEILWKILIVTLYFLKIITIGSCQVTCSGQTRFTCGDGTCISKAKVCNDKHDCAGGEDELGCNGHDICRPRDENMKTLNGYFCVRPCSKDASCRTGSCLCDDECGESCVDPRIRCAKDPPQVEHSLRSYVKRFINKRRVTRQRRYLFGDVAYYRCKGRKTLRGPLPRCMANGQWSMEIPQCVDSRESMNVGVAARLVMGDDSKPGAWPWFALITKKSTTPEKSLKRGNLIGGGSIINKHWILTAAHVLRKIRQYESIVFVGLSERPLKRGELVKSSVEMYSIAGFVEHPDYDRIARFDSDIALIKLGKKLDKQMQQTNANGVEGLIFGTSIRAISLPDCSTDRSESEQNHLRCPSIGEILTGPGYRATVVGFGHTYKVEDNLAPEDFRPPKKLQQATLIIKKRSWCLRKLQPATKLEFGKRLNFTVNMLCCRSGRSDACGGDSGGPLMREVTDNGTGSSYWVQIGIVSFGIGCATEYPGYYTKVERFTSWIKYVTSDAEGEVGICRRNINLVEDGKTCLKTCETYLDCSSSTETNKGCYCDGTCGMSCLNRILECLPPDSPVNGNVRWNHTRWGSKACYSCFEGFTLMGSECRTCNADENWGGRTPSCEGDDSSGTGSGDRDPRCLDDDEDCLTRSGSSPKTGCGKTEDDEGGCISDISGQGSGSGSNVEGSGR